MAFSVKNVEQLQKHLAENPYLSDAGLPSAIDAQVYIDFNGQIPDVNKTPNVHYWYMFMYTFTTDLLKKWIEKANTKGEEKAGKKKQQKKQEKKQEGDDLFDDDGDSKPAAPVKKPQPPKKAKKEVIAKSIVVFEVKVYEQDQDLDKLSSKILALEIDGLVWNKQPKKIPVVGKIFKLQMGCVIQDAKVLTDDIFQKIQQWQEVQSTDMISMQKL